MSRPVSIAVERGAHVVRAGRRYLGRDWPVVAAPLTSSVALRVAIPSVVILMIALLALRAPDAAHLVPLLVVAPALTASFAGPVATAMVGTVAVIVQILVRTVRADFDKADSMTQIGAGIAVTVFVVIFAAVHERNLKVLAQVRSVSEAAQRVVLRPLPDQVDSLRVASTYLAATAESRVGGDLYAVVRASGGARLIVGDVSGKGLATIGDAAVLLHSFREAAHDYPALPKLVEHLENTVARNLAETAALKEEAPEYFITAVMLNVPDDRPFLELVDCGHPPPLLLHGSRVTALEEGEAWPPLGLGGLVPSAGYEARTFRFDPGDVLVLYTDGVIEARNAAGDFYPLAERIAAFAASGAFEPQIMVDRLHEDLLLHAGGRLDDDAALVVVKRESGESGESGER